MFLIILRHERCVKKLLKKKTYQLSGFPDGFKTKMCERAVEDESEALEYVLDNLKTQGMCIRAMRREPTTMRNVSDNFKTQGAYEKTVEI